MFYIRIRALNPKVIIVFRIRIAIWGHRLQSQAHPTSFTVHHMSYKITNVSIIAPVNHHSRIWLVWFSEFYLSSFWGSLEKMGYFNPSTREQSVSSKQNSATWWFKSPFSGSKPGSTSLVINWLQNPVISHYMKWYSLTSHYLYIYIIIYIHCNYIIIPSSNS